MLNLPTEIVSGAYFCGRVVFVTMKYLELRNTLQNHIGSLATMNRTFIPCLGS